jgi:predicted nucleotidyltransferase
VTWRVPPFDRAFDELVTYVRATYAPIGIVVAGSIVRGEAGPTSDLDVFVVHGEPWRLRDQRRFAGVPAELFVNPAAQVRRYFATEHARARPCTAHMFATGELVEPVDPAIVELVREARDWLARPVDRTEAELEQLRYGAVDALDDARDTRDDATVRLLLGSVVQEIVAYAFISRRMFVPRRKDVVDKLAAIDADAAALVRQWAAEHDGLAIVEALAKRVLGVDTFFEWTSPREPVT